MLVYISTKERWHGEPIDDVRHPRDIEIKWTAEELAAIGLERTDPPAPDEAPMRRLVDSERNRRLREFVYKGERFQFDERSQAAILAAGTMAQIAIVAGADEGDLRWSDPDRDFTWIDADNKQHPMCAHQTLAFLQAAMVYKEAVAVAARNLKDMDPIPEDYASDDYWPG
jgi:hypothetical protein